MASAGARSRCHICGKLQYSGGMARIGNRWTCSDYRTGCIDEAVKRRDEKVTADKVAKVGK